MKSFPQELKHPSGRQLQMDPALIVVALKRKFKNARLNAQVERAGFVRESARQRPHKQESTLLHQVNDSQRLAWLRLPAERSFRRAAADLQKEIGSNLEFIAPVYRVAGVKDDGGLVCPLPNVLLICFRPDLDPKKAGVVLTSLRKLGLEEVPAKSRYLVRYRYFRLTGNTHAYDLRDLLLRRFKAYIADIRFETVPFIKPMTLSPNDTFYSSQWSMPQIDAEDAWDETTGHPSVIVAVLDSGCDLTHPDLQFVSDGVNLGTMSDDGSPVDSAHGTCCAGVIAARINNDRGIAGVAGKCLILPIAFHTWSDAEVAAGITYAADNGAHVLSMSFGQYDLGEEMSPAGWDFSIIDPAIEYADLHDVVMCAASGNEDVNTFNRYPARHELVMAIGGSSTDDNRKTTTSPDGEGWGANYADGISVVAPCVLIPTSDIRGEGGAEDGDYTMTFNGTSSAAPHVAGLAGLCRSTNCLISNSDVRDIIEQQTDKVGAVAYATSAGADNGTRNQPMGYGRINCSNVVDESGSLFVHQFNQLFNE